MKKHFFSVVIPIYNSAKYLPHALENLYMQNEDIEVVLTDDGSTDNWKDIVEDWKDKLDIVIVETDRQKQSISLNRQAGQNAATGEWVTFMDVDDLYIKDAFLTVRKKIVENNANYAVQFAHKEIENPDYAVNFRIDVDGGENYINSVFLHGKFFNNDNCLRKYKIQHFDYETLDDAPTTKQIDVFAETYNEQIFVFNKVIYLWGLWQDSASHSKLKYQLNQQLVVYTQLVRDTLRCVVLRSNEIPLENDEAVNRLYQVFVKEFIMCVCNFNIVKTNYGEIMDLENIRKFVIEIMQTFRVDLQTFKDSVIMRTDYFIKQTNDFNTVLNFACNSYITPKNMLDFLF